MKTCKRTLLIRLFTLCVGITCTPLRADIDTTLHPNDGIGDYQPKENPDTNAAEPDLKSPRDYLRRASAKYAFKDYNGAIAACTKAIGLVPKYAPAYEFRAMAETQLRNYDDAFADSSRAVMLDPGLSVAYNSRGVVEMDFFRDYERATADFNKCIQLAPTNSFPYANRALIKRHFKDYSGAFQDIGTAIEAEHKYAFAYAVRGYLQNDLFQFQAALESFRRAVEIDSSENKCRYRIWLIRARLGEQESATKELSEHLKSVPAVQAGQWPAPIERFLVGQLTEDDFLHVAKTSPGNPRVQRERLCEADYYIGMKHLLGGDTSGGAVFFQKALDMDVIGLFEYESAAAELGALNKSRP